MRKATFLLSVIIFLSNLLAAQQTVFFEDFENIPPKLTSSSSGSNAWVLNSTYHIDAGKSYHCAVKPSDTTFLTSDAFSTVSMSKVMLQFSHICKIEHLDAARLEVSPDDGQQWIPLSAQYYQGQNPFFANNGSKFSSISYSADWAAHDSSAVPTNTWWKQELFDLSSLVSNKLKVRIRFVLIDGQGSGLNGAGGNYGWLLDNIQVKGANSELFPPTIVFKENAPIDSVYYKGPFYIRADITDQSGIDTALLIYSKNSEAWDSLGMIPGGTTYLGLIADTSQISIGDTIRYYVKAWDASGASVSARMPVGGARQFVIYPPQSLPGCDIPISSFPFVENFESAKLGSETPSDPGALPFGWTREPSSGTQTTFMMLVGKGTTSQGETGPNNDHTLGNDAGKFVYAESASGAPQDTTYLQSPCFDISNLRFPELEFWYHMYGFDAGELNVLVWYGREWKKVWGASGDKGDEWRRATVDLTTYRGITKIRLEVVRGAGEWGDIAIDDVKLWDAPANDAGVISIFSNASPASVGSQPVWARIYNYGSADLSQAKINWEANGKPQNSVIWKGKLAPFVDSEPIHLGDYNFPEGSTYFKAWTSKPNDSTDGRNFNDTLKASIVACAGSLQGTYSVGTASSDFATINDAVFALKTCGLKGHVVFNIASGVYEQQIDLGAIPGLSNTATLTFQSATQKPTDVVIQYASASDEDKFTVRLKGAEYIHLKYLTIRNTGSTYSCPILLSDKASNNLIEGNIIRAGSAINSFSKGILSEGGLNYNNVIRNNDIANAYCGIDLQGGGQNVIEGNNIHDFYNEGIKVFKEYTITIAHNNLERTLSTGPVMMNLNNMADGSMVVGNRIVMADHSGAGVGIKLEAINRNSGEDTCFVINNMISITSGTGANIGLTLNNANLTQVLNNSINITVGGTTSKALYQLSGGPGAIGGIVILNNNLVNTRLGYSLYAGTPNTIIACNYNNYKTGGTNFVYYGSEVSDLQSLKSVSVDNSNSLSVAPGFVSATDLHSSSLDLLGAGKSSPHVGVDIDGDQRDGNIPCIGADEYKLFNNDVSLISFVEPKPICSGNSANVIVSLNNKGLNTLSSCLLNWSINGQVQPQFTFNGSLASSQATPINLGSYVFNHGQAYEIKVYSSQPNGSADLNPSNDTLISEFRVALPGGTYTVGSSDTADYANLDVCMNDIQAFGICGPVVINIEPGVYEARFDLDNTFGLSGTNTLKIKSATGDSSSVIVNYPSTLEESSAISLNNISHLTIEAISFNVNSIDAGVGVLLSGQSEYNTIKNCVINLRDGTSSKFSGIYFRSENVNYNKFINNKITKGYIGVDGRGASTTKLAKGNQFIGNQFIDYSNYGIWAYYHDSLIIRDNHFRNSAHSTRANTIYCVYSDGAAQIVGNRINVKGENIKSTSYCIYIKSSDATSSDPAIIANNMVDAHLSLSTAIRGVYMENCTNNYLLYNSVYITTASPSSRALETRSGSGNKLVNNIFVATEGHAAYFKDASTFAVADYNNYHTTGSNFIYHSAANRATLLEYQQSSGQGAHSLNLKPNFMSENDLHFFSGLMNEAGTPLTEVTFDIDGDSRDLLKPDIGADEFTPAPNDIAVVKIDMPEKVCGATAEKLQVQLVNHGDTIKNGFTIKYSLNSGLVWHSENVSAIINRQDTFSYTFKTSPNLSTVKDSIFNIMVEVELQGDALHFNDTLSAQVYSAIIPAAPLTTDAWSAYGTSEIVNATSPNTKEWYKTENSTELLGKGASFLTPVLFDTTVFYCATVATNGCTSSRTPLTVYVTGIPKGDVGIAEIYVNEGCSLDTNETISIAIYNQGAELVNANLSAQFRLGNNPWISPEMVNIPIPSHDTIIYNFTATANLKALHSDTTYNIWAKVSLKDDPYQANDSLLLANHKSRFTPDKPQVVSPITIAYGDMPILTASSSDVVLWFKEQTDIIEQGQGKSYAWNTPIYQTDTFYAQAGRGYLSSVIITEVDLGTEDRIEIQNVSGRPLDATGWKLIISDGSVDINNANSVQKEIGALQTNEVKYWSEKTGSNYWGNEINWTQGAKGWAIIVDDQGNIADLVVWGYTASEIASLEVEVGTMIISAALAWNGDGIKLSKDVLSRIAYNDTSGVQWENIATGNFGAINAKLTNSKPWPCVSERVPVVVKIGKPLALDAGANSVQTSPERPTEGSPAAIQVKIRNYGTDTLSSCNINYEKDGVLKHTYAWTGKLAFQEVSDYISIYTDAFSGGAHHIRIWVSDANGDPVAGINFNDTIEHSIKVCLSGEYTLGDASSDFKTFNEALDVLKAGGVCGNVVFNIKPGVYNNQLVLEEVYGADPDHRITFQSATGDSTDVVIYYKPQQSNNYVVHFNGGSYYTLKGLTVRSDDRYARSVVYSGINKGNIVENCIVESTIGIDANAIAFYDSYESASAGNIIRNNVIRNGYYGIYFGGNRDRYKNDLTITGNHISNFSLQAISVSYYNSVFINANQVSGNSSANSSLTAISLNNISGQNQVVGNKIMLQSASLIRGIHCQYGIGGITTPLLIANNVISINGGDHNTTALNLAYSNYIQCLHNSVNMINSSLSSKALSQIGGTGLSITNNAFAVDNGMIYAVSNPMSIDYCDYNNVYSEGSILAYWKEDIADFASLQTKSGKDLNSVSAKPYYRSEKDLHPMAIDLNNAATPMFQTLSYDADLQPRNTISPDMGAYEFTPALADAGLTELKSPISPLSTGSNDLYISLRNFGLDALKSVELMWEINGIAQTKKAWSGGLASGEYIDSLHLGTYTFNSGIHKLKAWTNLPNNTADANTQNDTLELSLVVCGTPMRGNYTVGDNSADFATIGDAVMQLMHCGIDGHVVINIHPGIYYEQIEIGEISGLSATQTLTFQSSTFDSTDVVLSYSATASANYTLRLKGADWISVKNLSIEAANPYFANVVVLEQGASHNTFQGNIIRSVESRSQASCGFYSPADQDEFNRFSNNHLQNTYYGFRLLGSAAKEEGTVIENNIIEAFLYNALDIRNARDIVISGNLIKTESNTKSAYGISLEQCTGMMVFGNKLEISVTQWAITLQIQACNSAQGNPAKVYNNFISVNHNDNAGRGVLLKNSSYVYLANNNILHQSTAGAAAALHLAGGNSNSIVNNNIINEGAAYAYYISTNSLPVESNYNNIYSNGSKFAYWKTNIADLAMLKVAHQMDANSISVDPYYASAFDLHTSNAALDAKGDILSWVKFDIDGEARDAQSPDIGADEFTPSQNDAAIVYIHAPKLTSAIQGASLIVKARIKNLGLDPLTSMDVGYSYASSQTYLQSWTGNLKQGDTTTITFTQPISVAQGLQSLCVFTKLTGDNNLHNDTLCKQFIGQPLVKPNYTDDFNQLTTQWVAEGNQWEYGEPKGTIIDSAYSTPYVWMTKLTGQYHHDAEASLLSPYFDFSKAKGATLSFQYRSDLMPEDGVLMEFLIEGNTTWQTLGYMGDPLANVNWYNAQSGGSQYWSGRTSQWLEATYGLSQFDELTRPVQFRLRFFSNSTHAADGFAIDNFSIQLPRIAQDAGVVSISKPTQGTIIGELANEVEVQIMNFGKDTLYSIPLHYAINGVVVANENFNVSGGLLPDSVKSFSFATTFQGPTTDYRLCAYTSLTNDRYTHNDSACSMLSALAPAYDAAISKLWVSPSWNDTTNSSINTTVYARIVNKGTSAISNIPIAYLINSAPMSDEVYTATIAPGDSVDFAFAKTYNTVKNYYLLCAKVKLATDANPDNNEECASYFGLDDVGIDQAEKELFSVEQNQPNPAYGQVRIDYYTPKSGKLHFTLYTALGQQILSEQYDASTGKQTLHLDANALSNGVYYYTLEFDNQRITYKMLVNKN